MEKYTMFMDWKNQYCENDSATKHDLQIQYYPYQITLAVVVVPVKAEEILR